MVEDPATIQRYLRTTQRQVNELSVLIDDLFQVAQLDAGGLAIQPAPCSLSDLISDTLESFSVLAKDKGVALSGSASPEIDPATLDAPRMGRVLANLVSNALRHTPEGGSVIISAWRKNGNLGIEVADRRGISRKTCRTCSTGSTGENLQPWNGRLRVGAGDRPGHRTAHGGEIAVESQLGAGTTFHISLPG
jgi:signal transduction histidine kinase